MFKTNKYSNWYGSIIEKARRRSIEGYREIHHIIPRSLGGSDIIDNLVQLTAREHFVCHLLLTKMVDGEYKYKMVKAALMMSVMQGPGQHRYRITSRTYDFLKKSAVIPDEVKQKMSKAQLMRFKNTAGTFLGRTHSEVTRLKMSKSASKPRSDKWKQSASINRTGRTAHNKGKPHSDETKKKISDAVTGKKNGFFGKSHSDEQRQKKREEKLFAPRKICEHCGKEVDSMNFSRWHGDKCKMKGNVC